MKIKLDPDILKAAIAVQQLRTEGKLAGVRRVIIHCNPEKEEMKTVEVDSKRLYPIG